MVSIMKSAIKMVVAGIIAIIVLSGFTLVYSNSGIHINNSSGATDYKWEPRQLKTTMGEGFAWFHMDENGFNNVYPPKDKITNLLIGSSHMEAININPKKNAGYLLNDMIPGYTYNIGTSGHRIYNCVRNIADAVDEYEPSGYIFLETDSIEMDSASMSGVIDGTYSHIPSYNTWFIRSINRYAPALLSLYNQIDVWRKGTNGNAAEHRRALDTEYEELLDQFLNKAQTDASKTGAKLVIFYKPRTLLDEEGTIINNTDQDALRIFKSTCDKNNIIFVDMTEPFTELYANENVLAHGFINTAIGKGHLNECGHRVLAETLAKTIEEESE